MKFKSTVVKSANDYEAKIRIAEILTDKDIYVNWGNKAGDIVKHEFLIEGKNAYKRAMILSESINKGQKWE